MSCLTVFLVVGCAKKEPQQTINEIVIKKEDQQNEILSHYLKETNKNKKEQLIGKIILSSKEINDYANKILQKSRYGYGFDIESDFYLTSKNNKNYDLLIKSDDLLQQLKIENKNGNSYFLEKNYNENLTKNEIKNFIKESNFPLNNLNDWLNGVPSGFNELKMFKKSNNYLLKEFSYQKSENKNIWNVKYDDYNKNLKPQKITIKNGEEFKINFDFKEHKGKYVTLKSYLENF